MGYLGAAPMGPSVSTVEAERFAASSRLLAAGTALNGGTLIKQPAPRSLG